MSGPMSHTYVERHTVFGEDGKPSLKQIKHEISVPPKPERLGVLLVGLGGNNGSTFYAGILANRKAIEFETKRGTIKSNYYGSFTQSATIRVGVKETSAGLEDEYKSVNDLVSLAHPSHDLVIHGWDISRANLYESAKRARVLEPDLLRQLKDDLEPIKPMAGAFNLEFVASNQEERADNTISGNNKQVVNQLQKDIEGFRAGHKLDKIVVLWTANTEKFLTPDIPDIAALEAMIDENKSLPASVLYAYASLKTNAVFLNGSPQNTLHPAILKLAQKSGGFVGGSDFKSGQTRFKTIMSDFLIGSGLRLASVVSYNHLGNNDGKNLSEPETFRSKEISKASVIDDAILANPLLYPPPSKEEEKSEKKSPIDHTVVIKYVPFVGDSKRALDEYTSEIFLGGLNTIQSYNVCEDSLLAVPIMIDLVILAEFLSRVRVDGASLGPVLSYLSFFFKAPVTNHEEYVVNSFSRQREMLCNFLKICSGLVPDDGTLTFAHF